MWLSPCLQCGVAGSDYDGCQYPLNVWLVSAYGSLLLSRLLHHFMLWLWHGDVNHCLTRWGPSVLVWLHVYVLSPALLVWSGIGCWWLASDHDCLPPSMNVSGVAVSIVLLALLALQWIWIALRCASNEARQQAEQHGGSIAMHACRALTRVHTLLLRDLRDSELAAWASEQPNHRGGGGGGLLVFQALSISIGQARPQGLSEQQLFALPTRQLRADERATELCSICLVEFPQLPPAAVGLASSSATLAGTSAGVSGGAVASIAAAAADGEESRATRLYSADPIDVRVLPCRHIFHIECLV